MLIIREDRAIATAYAAHIMDIFEHYRSRWISAGKKPSDYDPRKDANWQKRYFEDWRPAFAERLFWVSGGSPLPALKPNPLVHYAADRLTREAAAKKAAGTKQKAEKKATKGKTAGAKKKTAKKGKKKKKKTKKHS